MLSSDAIQFFLFSYSLTTPVPQCTIVCEDALPKAANESKMTLKEIIPALPSWAKNYNVRLNASETFNKRKHLSRYEPSLTILYKKRYIRLKYFTLRLIISTLQIKKEILLFV